MKNRRTFLRAGLEGSMLLILGAASDRGYAQTSSYVGSGIHKNHPLEFRVDDTYVPELSENEAALLQAATIQFLYNEHEPSSMKMYFWDLNPRDMGFLKKHIELIIEHIFIGIKQNLHIRPVDPIMILSLLYNESRFHPKVISRAGAVGIAQFMPDTALSYGLTPVAGIEIWNRYKEEKEKYKADKNNLINEFKNRYSINNFTADNVILRAVEKQDLGILKAYKEIPGEPEKANQIRKEYIDTLEQEFNKYNFFWSGRKNLESMDARVSYRSVIKAVEYIAKSLREHQGMATTGLASYNAGTAAVAVENEQSVLYRFGTIPTYSETIVYVQRFMAVYSSIKYQMFRLL